MDILILLAIIIGILLSLIQKVQKMANQQDMQQHIANCRTGIGDLKAKIEALQTAKVQAETDKAAAEAALADANAKIAALEAQPAADPNALPAAAADAVQADLATLDAEVTALNQAVV